MPLDFNGFQTYFNQVDSVDRSRTPVILFHGFGANGQDLLGLEQVLGPGYQVICPQAPLDLSSMMGFPGAYAWFPLHSGMIEPGKPVDMSAMQIPDKAQLLNNLSSWLESLLAEEPDQIYLGGFSQGSMLAYHLYDCLPAKWQNKIHLSLLSTHPIEIDSLSSSDSFKQTRIFQSHGFSDQVLPFDQATTMAKNFEEWGAKLEFTSFAGGHEIPMDVLQKWCGFIKQK
jgi:phospholipase/carboxylesterase